MVPDSPNVEQVYMGAEGVFEGATPGTLLIDMSSISPVTAVKVAKADIDDSLVRLQEANAIWQPVEHEVVLGNQVIIDATGKSDDGKPDQRENVGEAGDRPDVHGVARRPAEAGRGAPGVDAEVEVGRAAGVDPHQDFVLYGWFYRFFPEL